MPNHNDIYLTYIGGPTLLIEIDGLRLLTDPTFDQPQDYQAGPFTHSKLAGPAIEPSDIGRVDVVLLSHDHHFDNLDRSGRDFLNNANKVLTTKEAAVRLQGHAIGLDAGEELELTTASGKTLSIIGTPARHGPAGGSRSSYRFSLVC